MKAIYNILFLFSAGLLPFIGQAQCLIPNHGNEAETSWQSCEMTQSSNSDRDAGHWIMYDFGHIYQIKEAIFWNFNVANELNKGVKRIAIDYSVDGDTWKLLDEFDLLQAAGEIDYEGEPAIDLRGIEMRYALITVLENWGHDDCSGFSEIRFNIGVSTTTSVDEEEEKEVEPFAVFAYPNPAEDFIKIVSDNGHIEFVEITDVLGKRVTSQEFDKIYNTTLDISSLASGMYWIKVQGDQQTDKIQFTKVTTE